MVPLTLAARNEHTARAAIHWLIALVRLHLPLFLFLAALLGIGWLLAGWGLRGRQLLRWCLVPLLSAVAMICIIGPDRLFPKKPFEGPHLITLSTNHALTALDLPGFAAALVAGGLALQALRARRDT